MPTRPGRPAATLSSLENLASDFELVGRLDGYPSWVSSSPAVDSPEPS
jgi:hypothetical protein